MRIGSLAVHQRLAAILPFMAFPRIGKISGERVAAHQRTTDKPTSKMPADPKGFAFRSHASKIGDPLTHIDSGGCHARHQSAHREQFGVQGRFLYLLRHHRHSSVSELVVLTCLPVMSLQFIQWSSSTLQALQEDDVGLLEVSLHLQRV